jgi:hypothetical protein
VYQAQQRVASLYFQDGSIDDACPPLKALLHVMAYGHYEGKTVDDPSIRSMFTREALLESEWYRERLRIKQQREYALWLQHREYIRQRLNETEPTETWHRVLTEKLETAERMLAEVEELGYLEKLSGTLGADWVHRDVEKWKIEYG